MSEGTSLAVLFSANLWPGGGLLPVNAQMTRRDVGYTLIEVMVALAIITIAVGLALPHYLQWKAQSNLRQATSEVATQLTLARMAAMNRNRGVDVTVQDSGGSARVSAVTTASGVSVLDASVPSKGTSIVGSPITVSFSSMGLRTSGGTGVQTIGVCNSYKLQYSVTVIPVGKVNWSTAPSATPCP